MKHRIIESALLCFGIIVLGWFIKSGLSSFTNNSRVVNVKGLAEIEVKANKVTWPLAFKALGNDLPSLYTQISTTNDLIVKYLKSNGITDSEISISAPETIDLKAERYNTNQSNERYNITSIITVTSNNVDCVRSLMSKQSELLKQGIALTVDDYKYHVQYTYTGLNDIKPKMIEEATKNARQAAMKFAADSQSKLGKIKSAQQGQFSISDRDEFTPYIKTIRVVNTLDYFIED